eukprot:m.52285 g.52285  ORF g.52285 m.52285 type:complete len:53 (-) comp9092_c0_seq1:1209-1367(-)
MLPFASSPDGHHTTCAHSASSTALRTISSVSDRCTLFSPSAEASRSFRIHPS